MRPICNRDLSSAYGVILGVAVAVLMMACATEKQFENVINTWLGAPIERLTQGGWGKKPTPKIILPNGNVEYSYNASKAGSPLPDTCFVFFEVDQNTQKIIHIRHEGNRCKQTPFV